MKKLLLVISLIVVILMSGCVSTPQDDYVTREEFNTLQEQVTAMQSYMDRMVWEGYLLDENSTVNLDKGNLFVSVNYFENLAAKEVDYVDKTKFPEYIWDEFDNYISTDAMFDLLSTKYIGVYSDTHVLDKLIVSIYKPEEMSNEEYIAKISMLLLELSDYDFYTLNKDLELIFVAGSSQVMHVPLSYFNNDKYVISAHMFYNEMFEINIEDSHNPFIFDKEAVAILVQGYIDNNDFEGYALPNYK